MCVDDGEGKGGEEEFGINYSESMGPSEQFNITQNEPSLLFVTES